MEAANRCQPGMTADELGDLDVDSPIPYTLTALGHREVSIWRTEEQLETCAHRWRFRHKQLECDHCGLERELPASSGQSIPAYLKGDRK